MTVDDVPLTASEEGEMAKYLAGYGAPVPEEKHNVHKFLHDVVTTIDTTRLGNLEKEEVGMPKLPTRSLKELALFCDEVANMKWFGDYFRKRSEILTSTSLSKNAKLLETAVTTTRQVADVTKTKIPPKKKGGFFGKKPEQTEGVE